MKTFYEMLQILESYRYDFRGRPMSYLPPDEAHPDLEYDYESIRWRNWSEDSRPVYIVGGSFVDEDNVRLPWLDSYVPRVLALGHEGHESMPRYPDDHEKDFLAGKSDYGKAMWLFFDISIGSVYFRDRSAEEIVDLAIKVKDARLLVDDNNTIDLPDSVNGWIASRFFDKYDFFDS